MLLRSRAPLRRAAAGAAAGAATAAGAPAAGASACAVVVRAVVLQQSRVSSLVRCGHHVHVAIALPTRARARALSVTPARSFSSAASSSPTPLSIPDIPLLTRAAAADRADRIAITDPNGRHFTYGELVRDAHATSQLLAEHAGAAASRDMQGARAVFLVGPSHDHVRVQWGSFIAGAMAVPLHPGHAPAEIEYIVDDTNAAVLVASAEFAPRLAPIAEQRRIPLLILPSEAAPTAPTTTSTSTIAVTPFDSSRGAILIYTSGTTGKPKGVVITHAMLAAQVQSLVQAWEWTSADHILHVLPLHHVHGVVNVLTCSLWSGARCTFMAKFDAVECWNAFVRHPDLTLFMAVPTIYSRLIRAFEEASPAQREAWRAACKSFRLMVSGSAALPAPVMDKWQAVSGHVLLERYGMSEIGMALSNPLHGVRKPGMVGKPLPGVQVRIDVLSASDGDQTTTTTTQHSHEQGMSPLGELLVRGPTVFSEYLNKPAATAESFTTDGWFRTGDVVQVDADGDYKIVGRASVDVLKSGGYKISALDVERELLSHPSVVECAVVGAPSEEYGQVVTALVVWAGGGGGSDRATPVSERVSTLRAWCASRLSSYQVPRVYKFVDVIPRNAMGKINKKELLKLLPSLP